MKTSLIRQRWLDFFASKDHEICPSVSLISPDPSILFTIAGMVPFIPYILGTEPAPWPRAASVQKCVRTNDVEEVGKTTRHGTFFQMCGNFSFGDYFKEGASKYAWELLTTPIDKGGYGLDGERLWVTVWEEDAEAQDIWLRQIGLDKERVQLLPREEIFWDTGQPGPAGPCAEIHYDRGPEYGPDGGPMVDTGGDRFLEIWNLVFDQYRRGEGKGKDYPLLGELDQKAIDTGLGLERLAFLLQGKNNMYEIDEVYPVIAAAEEMSGRKYGKDHGDDVQMRVVADHIRSSLMLINDGVRPANEGRGYVLRRLMRRAVRSMRLLGVEDPCLPVLLPVSQNVMKDSYPDLETNWKTISEVAYAEEDAFRRTLTQGLTILDTAVKKAKQKSSDPVLAGDDAFQLHDTYGFPFDLTLEMAAEHGVKVDEKRFRELMEEQKQRARADALAKKTGHVDARIYHEILDKLGHPNKFLGYTENAASAKVIGILVDGQPVPAASAPAEVEVILDQTPFYAEAGGQQADHGTITVAGGGLVEVMDCQAPVKGLNVHRGTLVEGDISLDATAHAEIDTERRLAIARAHTSTHVVHQLLLDELGDGATQAGSENSPGQLRFDFRNPSGLSDSLIDEIEADANVRVGQDLGVADYELPIEEAKKLGAQAIFGEKYGKIVRVVDIGDGWSREFCGGTHVPTTGNIGRIVVLGESSIGSGIRRIEALVGDTAYGFQAKEHALVSQLSQLVGAQPDDLVSRVDTLMSRLKAAEKELDQVRLANLMSNLDGLLAQQVTLGKNQAVVVNLGEVPGAEAIREMAVKLRERLGEAKPAVVCLLGVANDKPSVVVATNAAAREGGVKAGALVKAAAGAMGGGGGGRDDLAQGGGSDVSKLDDAKQAVEKLLG